MVRLGFTTIWLTWITERISCFALASSDSFLFLFYLISFSARRNASVLQLSGGYFDVLLSLLSERNRPHWNPLHFPDELYCPHLGGGGLIPGEVIALLIFCHSVKNDNVSFLTQTIVVSFVQMFLFSSLVCWRRWVSKEGRTGVFSWCLISSFYFVWNVNLENCSSWLVTWRFCVNREEPELLTDISDFTTEF